MLLRLVGGSSSPLGSSPSSSSLPPSSLINYKFLKLRRRPFGPFPINLRSPSIRILSTTRTNRNAFPSSEEASETEWDIVDDEIREDDGSNPWEGAVVYTRNAAVSHLEYSTTLERLGLGKVSSEFSKNRASEMGLRVVKVKNDCSSGTPVLISLDLTRRKRRLRLDGIIRTVLSLNCNRCGEPAAQSIYSEFSLLLHEEPVQEPETMNMSLHSGDYRDLKSFETSEEKEDASIDADDQLYFPPHEKTIDISKNIRDLVHVEINISALCDPKCKGLCLKCGKNLNISGCACKNHVVEEKVYGPLGHLKDQMQHI